MCVLNLSFIFIMTKTYFCKINLDPTSVRDLFKLSGRKRKKKEINSTKQPKVRPSPKYAQLSTHSNK